MTIATGPGTGAISRNPVLDHYHRLPDIVSACAQERAGRPDPEAFRPDFDFPPLDARMREFLAPAALSWRPLPDLDGRRMRLLDLTGNPGTRTTKTLASLLIVARAVAHVRRTGVPVVLVTPTSANKGTALRDAVLRALDLGLAEPHQLRVVTVCPAVCRDKLRRSRLATDPELRALNPVLVHTGQQAEDVKPLTRAFVHAHAAEWARRTGGRLWFSLDLANYMVADTTRALFEHDVDPIPPGEVRVHAHAVSSAFGLLGYHTGREILEATGEAAGGPRPESFLVQHLHIPDMVLSQRFGSFDRRNAPAYEWDERAELYRQDREPCFPYVTDTPNEILDPTFYTHRPGTSERMNEIIGKFGGGGIVVSRRECLEHYEAIARDLSEAGIPLPDDPRRLAEWSLLMAMTGVREGVRRGLIGPDRTIVVHASGTYAHGEYEPLREGDYQWVHDEADVAAAVGVA
ncbi:DUF6002 family protein [Streptomyces sp. ME02-6978a]|uniref:DUF6002 family protein n=1 Tax=Streptomyces TaxID=1883 RepID=UPI0029A80B19|nr:MULTISPECIES: DUF6002 family protein [unclassified Streptomyces]MDX3090450.1 DUF6002 family protein [Streptomyces sp. ME12-02E]MDX3330447.1 DUF6002 family protein [Streptomyces sp. ME02-6978a]